MQRLMRNTAWGVALGAVVLGATALLQWALLCLGEAYHEVQLVVFRPSTEALFREHGRPTVSLVGVGTYALLCLAYAVLLRAAVHPIVTPRGRRGLVTPILAVFCVSLIDLCVIDRYFLSVVLPSSAWVAYYDLTKRWAPPLFEIYDQWAPSRTWPWIFAHTVLAGTVLAWWLWVSKRQSATVPGDGVPAQPSP